MKILIYSAITAFIVIVIPINEITSSVSIVSVNKQWFLSVAQSPEGELVLMWMKFSSEQFDSK